jgi:hypothetical protein
MLLDKKYKTGLRRYVFTAVGVMVFCLLVYPFLQRWIVNDTEKKGDILFHAVTRYKSSHGYYPSSLDDGELKQYSRYALVHRPFYYKLYKNAAGENKFTIVIYSFDGMIGNRYSDSESWLYND